MNDTEFMPSVQLRPFVSAYRIIESRDEVVNRVVPNTSIAIAFRLQGQISFVNSTAITRLPAITFSGLRKSVRLINYAPRTASLIVLFKETGVSAFFKQPLHELFEESISLDNFLPGSELAIIEDRLASAYSHKEMIAIIEKFLLDKLLFSKPDQLITDAVAKIYSENGNLKIKDLASRLYISQDAFEKRFRKVVGTSPKQFSLIVKMKTIIGRPPISSSLLDIALESGYYDQSHFNKDFKLFTGLTPTEFFKSGMYW